MYWKRGFLEIEKIFNNKGGVTGVPSGFPELDSKTSGFQKRRYDINSSKTFYGKDNFALNLAQYAALREGKSVAIFSL